MSVNTVVLTASPLSREFQERLENELGVVEHFVTLSDFRRRSPGELIRTLHALRRRPWLLVVEDDTSAAVLPVAQTIAAVTLPRRIEIVGPDLARRRVRTLAAVPALARLVAASVDGVLALRRARIELEELTRSERQPATFAGGTVAHLNATLWVGVKVGGSIAHIAGVVNELNRRGTDVLVLSTVQPVAIDTAVRTARIRLPQTLGMPFEGNLFRLQRDAVNQAEEALRAAGCGLVYQRLSVGNYLGVVLSRRLGIPLVLEYNGSEVWAARNWGRPLRFEAASKQAEEACLRHAHRIVTVSEVLRDELIERGVPAESIVCHANGVDERRFDPGAFDAATLEHARTRLGLPPDAVVVTFVGTFGMWHGVEVFARAIRTLLASDPEWVERHRAQFLLVGDGSRMPEVRSILAGIQPDAVTLTGLVRQEDAPVHMALSDVLVSPHVPNEDGSRFFGSPTKLFEYMAMAKPIVASRLDQIEDVLAGGLDAAALPVGAPGTSVDVPAVLARPGSEEELLAGIRFAVERPDWRAALGAAARERVLARYTWRHHVAAIMDALPR